MPHAEQPILTLQHENVFQTKIELEHAVLCPTMSLLAVVTEDQNVEVWRMSGQRACSFKKAFGSCAVAAICWTPDGRTLAVTRTDGTAEYCFVDTGDILRTLVPVPQQSGQSISKLMLVKWIDQYTDPSLLQQEELSNGNEDGLSIDEWFSQTMKITDPALHAVQGSDKDIKDWPKKVALYDMEKVLPKLSTLPAAEDSAIIKAYPHLTRFENTSVLDTLFHRFPSPIDQCTASLGLYVTEDGRANICSADAVRLGTTSVIGSGHVLDHTSSPTSHTQLFLVGSSGKASISLLDLDSVRKTGLYFSLLTSKLARLDQAFAYIICSISCQRSAWAGGQDLASRFLGNINETLSETEPDVTIVGALYHLAVTGDCWPEVKEWLVDILAERGRARWTAAVASCYSTVVSLVHETLLPALDRASIIAERLQSLARNIPAIPMFNIDSGLLDRISDQLQLIRILAHHVLIHAAAEARQFQVFAEWLQMQLLLQSTEADSVAADDIADKIAAMDYAQLLEYIKTAMMTSRVNLFYGLPTPEVLAKAGRQQPSEMTEALHIVLDQHKTEPIQPTSTTLVANLLFHAASLPLLLAPIMKAVVAGFEKKLVISPDIPLAATTPEHTAMSLLILPINTKHTEQSSASKGSTVLQGFTAIASSSNILHVSRIEYLQDMQGTARPKRKQTTALRFEPNSIKIHDMRFLTEDTLVILLSTQNSSYLIQLSCRSIHSKRTSKTLSISWDEALTTRIDAVPDSPTLQSISLKTIESKALLTFSHPNGIGAFVPAKFTCNDQSMKQFPDSEDVPASDGGIVILEQDERRWRVYTASNPAEAVSS